MSTTLREKPLPTPPQQASCRQIPGIAPNPASRRNCADCALLEELDSMLREIIVLRERGMRCLASLTDRQREIMHMVLAGHPSKNIAMDIGISQRTVENHRAHIMHRTGCKSIPELSRLVFCASWYAGAQ